MANPAPVTPAANGNGNDDSGTKFYFAAVVLGLALVAYAIMVIYLFRHTDATEPTWSRELLLLTGVEAITFAGVGWLFGKEVNRGAAEAAKDANEKASAKAEQAGVEEGKGKTLAAAVRTANADQTVRSELDGVAGASNATRSQLDSLIALADELYPPGQ